MQDQDIIPPLPGGSTELQETGPFFQFLRLCGAHMQNHHIV